MALQFKKAVKRDAKLRLALCGPAGSGKTYSSLRIATELGGPIAYVDTEHGSASKYAHTDQCGGRAKCENPHHFDFDVIEPDVFDPRDLCEMIEGAVSSAYRCIIVDSLSHYWMGKGGELEMVDLAAGKAKGNSFAGWKSVTPFHTQLVDTIISAKIHVIAGIRTKTEWIVEKNDKGQSVPRKIGLAPIMRDGIEFEFDVCGDLDQDNTLTISKSRCPELSGKSINRPGKDMARTLKEWCTGAPAEPLAPPATKQVGTQQPGTTPSDPTKSNVTGSGKPWTTFKGMLEYFSGMKDVIGETAYYAILDAHGVKHANEFKSGDKAVACYAALGAEQARIASQKEAA